ncbi:histidine kinase [Fibrella sp. USSR17]
MQRLNDKWMRIAGVPLLALIGQWMMYGYTNTPYPNDWRIPFFFTIGAVLVWESNRLGIILSRRRYPELAQTLKRIVYQLIWFVVFCSLIRITQTFIYQLIGLWQDSSASSFQPYFFNTLVSVVGTIQVAAVLEGIYLYQRWQVMYTETQELKKVNLQSQLDSLKTQLNPHFLFNNLNSLSALIASDATEAERFLDELSTVYRYLLQQNSRSLCPLTDELAFLDAYFHLIKTRYGDGISLKMTIDAHYMTYLIPPLTLQILFENAIKYNVISTSCPLTIRIFSQDGKLYIENNLQARKVTVPTDQVGLENVIMKYKLLDHSSVLIHHDKAIFRVGIPLIVPQPNLLTT